MTMDVSNRKMDIVKSDSPVNAQNCDEHTEITSVPIKVAKRPFDVAFLMLPDEKLKQKQHKILKATYSKHSHHHAVPDVTTYMNNNNNNNDSSSVDDDEDEEIEVGTNLEFSSIRHKYFPTQKQQIFDDPSPIKAKSLDELRQKILPTSGGGGSSEQKSAFTKVNLVASKDSSSSSSGLRLSPNLSISPDLSYQNSLSPSPPILTSRGGNYQNLTPNVLASSQIFKNHHQQQQQINAVTTAYQSTFLAENFAQHHQNSPNNLEQFLLKTPNDLVHHPHHHQHQNHQSSFTTSKIRPGSSSMYSSSSNRPELAHYAGYHPHFPGGAHHHHHNPEMLKISGSPTEQQLRNPVAHAAILTSLLPPSLAALSLPAAQNVCAKCNISFRMTSDLVYHMRSHHKNDSADMQKRRREEKLKCPVCSESFRERHHLTRHMTAHQDKDDDEKNCVGSGGGKANSKLSIS